MAPLLWRSPHLLFLSLMGPLPLPLPHSPFLLHPFFPLLTSLTHRPPLRLLLPPPLPSPAPSFPLPHTAPYPLGPANAAPFPPLPPPLPPLSTTQTLLGTTIGAPKTMISFSASNATNDFDLAGATSPPKCSAQSLRSALGGPNFLNYNDWLHHDLRR